MNHVIYTMSRMLKLALNIESLFLYILWNTFLGTFKVYKRLGKIAEQFLLLFQSRSRQKKVNKHSKFDANFKFWQLVQNDMIHTINTNLHITYLLRIHTLSRYHANSGPGFSFFIQIFGPRGPPLYPGWTSVDFLLTTYPPT